VNEAAAKRAGLKAGDTLTSVPRKSGVLLNKDGKPVAFLVPTENAPLSKNVELSR
jgi:hypothetical protein